MNGSYPTAAEPAYGAADAFASFSGEASQPNGLGSSSMFDSTSQYTPTAYTPSAAAPASAPPRPAQPRQPGVPGRAANPAAPTPAVDLRVSVSDPQMSSESAVPVSVPGACMAMQHKAPRCTSAHRRAAHILPAQPSYLNQA